MDLVRPVETDPVPAGFEPEQDPGPGEVEAVTGSTLGGGARGRVATLDS